ncbi:MAG: response regulator [Steroidobacteraceae bacterium]|nr:response regulator [Steroidobacteraceae bacterium]
MTRPRRTPRILVVDDDPGLLRLLTIRLRSQKYEVEPAPSATEALAAVARFRPDLVITDLRMAQMDGIALLKELQRRWPSLNVIMLTAHGTIPDAVKATQSGAFAFLTKPVEKEQLLDEVRRALKTSGYSDTDTDDWRAEFATRSPLLEDRLDKAHRVAGTDAAVFITGETGTGKELLARAIHRASPRREAELVTLECGALEAATGEATATSEAALSRALDEARGGTLLLRELDAMPLPLQSRLARLLEGRDARVIATLDEPTTEPAKLSPELLDRLGAVSVEMPPLDQRREDIPLLVQQALDDVAAETGQPKRGCSPEAMELLASARWPGNVRQLRMVVRQAATTGAGAVITPQQVEEAQGQTTQLPSFDEARDEFTQRYLVQLLQITEGNVSQAARLAKRNRTDFYKLLSRHGIEPEEFKR